MFQILSAVEKMTRILELVETLMSNATGFTVEALDRLHTSKEKLEGDEGALRPLFQGIVGHVARQYL